ncbi:MAG: hypothetical protein OXC63_00125 [Aestuariivita sp.]|nr:hypothetical protein [Aestuariivita sp.]
MRTMICFLISACVFNSAVHAACRDIVVLSRDAKYLLLDSNNLELRDVGNLWWLGLRQIDYVYPGSNLNFASFSTEFHADVSTGYRMHVGPGLRIDPSPEMPFIDLYLLENLGRDYQSHQDVLFADSSKLGIENVDKYSMDRLKWMQNEETIVFSYDQYKYALVSSNLELISQFDFDSSMLSAQCRKGDEYFFASSRSVLSLDIATGEANSPSWVNPEYRFSRTFEGCKVLTYWRGENAGMSAASKYQLIDYSNGNILSEFDLDIELSNYHLFADGSRWLMQELEMVSEGSYAGTNTFRLIDTLSGESILEAELDIGDAILPDSSDGRRFCETGSKEERVVAIDGNTIYLIDAHSLTVLASKTLPFEERIFVF